MYTYGVSIVGISIMVSMIASQKVITMAGNDDEEDTVKITKKDLSDTNIAFDLPDLTTVDTSSGSFQLEAYKSVNNDQILWDRDSSNGKTEVSSKISQLIWVSVGQPVLVKTAHPSKSKSVEIFHSSHYGFFSYIQMLTPAHRRVLSTTASTKYQVKVEDSQIVNLILSKFECSLRLYDDIGNKYLLKGSVFDFRHFPLRINFEASPRSMERKLFLQMLQDGSDLDFMCNMASTGKLMKTNTLTITSQQQRMIGIEEKLFGPANSDNSNSNAYVTRDQMTGLSSEMYTTLNIVEDYQMSEGQFSDAFVEGMINQIATEQFKPVPIDTVLASLSKYGLDIGEDLKPDVIKKDLGSIMTIEKKDEKSRIILDEANYKKYEESNSNSGGGGLNILSFGATANWANNNSKGSTAEAKSLNDQLRELNTVSQKDVQWEIVGNKVIPKSLNVARVTRTKLGQTLSFNRVQVKSYLAPFDRKFAIHTNRAPASISVADTVLSRISALEADIQKINSGPSRETSASKIYTVKTDCQKMETRLSESIRDVNSQLTSSIQTLSAKALKKCRICFMESSENKACKGSLYTCTPYTESNSYSGWTEPFITDHTSGGCTYRWMIHCLV